MVLAGDVMTKMAAGDDHRFLKLRSLSKHFPAFTLNVFDYDEVAM
jgi:hypothetical protein